MSSIYRLGVVVVNGDGKFISVDERIRFTAGICRDFDTCATLLSATTLNMQLFKYSLSILLLAVSALANAAAEPPKELVIDVTHLPSECPVKAQTGDSIKVHYVSLIAFVSNCEESLTFVIDRNTSCQWQ